jgi:CheY-like chemotaxis protein
MRRHLRSLLEALGVSVLEASNGEEGMQRVYDDRPDLVIMEVQIPRMDGHDVLRAMKTNPATRELPVVVLTTVDDEEEGWSLRDMGAAAFLVKPAQHDVIELLVEKFVH